MNQDLVPTNVIINASTPAAGKLHILVVTEYAESFHKFLKARNVNCTPPSDAVWQSRRLYQDANGRWRDEQECVIHSIDADGTMQQFWEWASDWFSGILGKSDSN